MSEITDFLKNELYPALYERMDTAFPGQEWRRWRNGKWYSPFHLSGNRTKDSGGSYVSRLYPSRVADTNGSESLSFLDYDMRINGGDKRDSIKRLCQACGLEVPNYNSEEFKQYQERQERLFAAWAKAKRALFQEEGADVLRYLREERHYSDELIKEMGLGYMSAKVQEELFALELIGYNQPDGRRVNPPTPYKLLIPYIAGGTLYGFKMRLIKPGTDSRGNALPKYRNTYKLQKKASLFGVAGTKLSSYGEDKDITIVEGELDALHAQAVGLPNVVAAAGMELSPEQLSELKGKGASKVTLFLDLDEPGSKAEEKKKDTILRALKAIREAGLAGFVASFPNTQDGSKIDLDSFLLSHTPEEAENIIGKGTSEIMYRYEDLKSRTLFRNGEEVEDKDLCDFKRGLLLLLADTTPSERDVILYDVENLTDGAITAASLREEAEQLQEEENRRKQRKDALSTLDELKGRIDNGEPLEPILREMAKKGASLSQVSRETEYARYLEEDVEELFAQYREEYRGLETGIELSLGTDEAYSLSFPSGCLSIIGAPSNHGKSRLLQSLAIDAASAPGAGEVLYITYEENKKNVNRQLLNAFCNVELTMKTAKHGNEQTLQEYLQTGSTKYIKADKLQEFKEKEKAYKNLLREGRLRIIKPGDNYIETLIGLLKYATSHKEHTIKAVFLDYAQELYLENTRKNAARTDELKDIMIALDLVAQETDLPFVIAAQMKAETDSPLTMGKEDIADSIWIARKASEILLLWSSKERPTRDTDGKKLFAVEKELPELSIGERGKIYVKLAKSRMIPTGASAILTINGNTGRVQTQPQQTERMRLPEGL